MSRELLIPSNVNPNITFWLFKTMTGLTGIINLNLILIGKIVIFSFEATIKLSE